MFTWKKEIDVYRETATLVVGIQEQNVPSPFLPIVDKLKEKKDQLFDFATVTEWLPIDGFQCRAVLFVGLGNKEKYTIKDLQTICSKIYKGLKDDSVILVDTFYPLSQDTAWLVEKMTETIGLVRYTFRGYKTKKTEDLEKTLGTVTFVAPEDVSAAIESGVILAEATNHTRDLVNEPRNKMTPLTLADYARDLALQLGLEFKIFDKKEIEALGMGAFLAVNQGSSIEPRLIHLKYRNRPSDPQVTALIGKGVTYDTGGYSLKPRTSMAGMKTDMAGAAAVLGAIEAIAKKKLPVNVDVVIAATENLISSEAIVPDDVVVSMSGKTIEILNTDAEGRLTLVDAITYAKKNGATRLIDVATLTGGVITALGLDITGGFTNNQDFYKAFEEAAKQSGEDIWQLPVDPFREACRKSDVADYNNSPGREGHASFGAAMLAEFAEDTPWIHLDIAGTSGKRSDYLLGPAGATGVMVRTLVKLFELESQLF
ncbi:MAG TPA: leucyl aminopeptidase [Haloplasmataceae bacterium]